MSFITEVEGHYRILAFLVLRARIDPMRFMVAFMQEGVL